MEGKAQPWATHLHRLGVQAHIQSGDQEGGPRLHRSISSLHRSGHSARLVGSSCRLLLLQHNLGERGNVLLERCLAWRRDDGGVDSLRFGEGRAEGKEETSQSKQKGSSQPCVGRRRRRRQRPAGAGQRVKNTAPFAFTQRLLCAGNMLFLPFFSACSGSQAPRARSFHNIKPRMPCGQGMAGWRAAGRPVGSMARKAPNQPSHTI